MICLNYSIVKILILFETYDFRNYLSPLCRHACSTATASQIPEVQGVQRASRTYWLLCTIQILFKIEDQVCELLLILKAQNVPNKQNLDKIDFLSFRTFRCPLFPKPVIWLGLFLTLLTARLLQVMQNLFGQANKLQKSGASKWCYIPKYIV